MSSEGDLSVAPGSERPLKAKGQAQVGETLRKKSVRSKVLIWRPRTL